MNTLKLKPIFKQPIWSGSRLAAFKGCEQTDQPIGESWEISATQKNVSIIDSEPFVGMSLHTLIERYPEALLGERVIQTYGKKFPLLVKFIDAADNLSIQVHPNDEQAHKVGQPFGKSEMWYVIDAAPGARIYAGLKESIDGFDTMMRLLDEGKIDETLCSYEVHPGDVFYIPAGTVHTIGRGVLIAEVQQSSELTYRVFDYNRTDAQGCSRELHIEESRCAIHFGGSNQTQIDYEPPIGNARCLIESPIFTVSILNIEPNGHLIRDLKEKKSFVTYQCISGKAIMMDASGTETTINRGETILVPASCADVVFIGCESTNLLEAYL